MARAAIEDPLKVFRFRVLIDGFARAGFSSVSGLKRTTEKAEYREGGMNETKQKSAGLTDYGDITLKRGQIIGSSRGGDSDIIDWAELVHDVAIGGNAANYRKDFTIEQYNSLNDRACYWEVYDAWITDATFMSDMSADSSDNSYEEITLANEGHKYFPGLGKLSTTNTDKYL